MPTVQTFDLQGTSIRPGHIFLTLKVGAPDHILSAIHLMRQSQPFQAIVVKFCQSLLNDVFGESTSLTDTPY